MGVFNAVIELHALYHVQNLLKLVPGAAKVPAPAGVLHEEPMVWEMSRGLHKLKGFGFAETEGKPTERHKQPRALARSVEIRLSNDRCCHPGILKGEK
jgi:hypothetical protein